MKLNWQISGGEFFELFRPAALIVSAIVSAWVLGSARRWRFRSYLTIAWVLGAFVLPLVVLPLFIIARGATKRRTQLSSATNEAAPHEIINGTAATTRFRYLFPLAYFWLLLALIGFYFYRDYNSVDAHLARAVQAKLKSQREKTIREYRAALALEDDAHTHKLLGIELIEGNQPQEALREFRLAESRGEPDESLPFRIGQALDATGNHIGATIEFRRFLESQACSRVQPDDRCEPTRVRLQSSPGK